MIPTGQVDVFALVGLGLGELAERMGIVFHELSAERSLASMPVEGNRQPFGLLHGGAHVALAETLGSMSAAAHAGSDYRAVGVEINASHTRPVREGHVFGTCTALSLGRRMTVHEIVIRDAQGERLSTVRMTNLLTARQHPAGGAAPTAG